MTWINRRWTQIPCFSLSISSFVSIFLNRVEGAWWTELFSFFHFSQLEICVHPLNLRHLRSHDTTSAERSKCFRPDGNQCCLRVWGEACRIGGTHG